MRIQCIITLLLVILSACAMGSPDSTGQQSSALQTACFPSEFDVDCGVVPAEDGGYFDISGALFGLPIPPGVSQTSAVCTGGGYNTECLASYTDGYVDKCWLSYISGAGWGVACSETPSS